MPTPIESKIEEFNERFIRPLNFGDEKLAALIVEKDSTLIQDFLRSALTSIYEEGRRDSFVRGQTYQLEIEAPTMLKNFENGWNLALQEVEKKLPPEITDRYPITDGIQSSEEQYAERRGYNEFREKILKLLTHLKK